MCDTIVALGNSTVDGVALFAKNSDRDPNEGQYLEFIPRQRHTPGEKVRCTYIEVPQVEETYAVLLSRPFWMWGSEMGMNEHGVTIGNEAVFTREPYATTGLLGMDLMRLALERSVTARQSLDILIHLLEEYGQGGQAGFQHKSYYHNSFLIVDPREAWVMQTAGRYWAALQVRDFYTISNGLTIGSEWDLASPQLVQHAIERGWCRSKDDFHFARCYSDRLYTHFSQCRLRRQRTMELVQAGPLSVKALIAALRDHSPRREDPAWGPALGSMGQVCMHAGFGPFRPSQSTASLVVHLDPRLFTCYATATSAPCTGIFKPFFFEAGLLETDARPAGRYDPDSLFWQHERLHRAVLEDYAPRLALYSAERDALEAGFLAAAQQMEERYLDTPPQERRAPLAAFTAECFARAGGRTRQWAEQVRATPAGRPLPLAYRIAWRANNRLAGMEQ